MHQSLSSIVECWIRSQAFRKHVRARRLSLAAAKHVAVTLATASRPRSATRISALASISLHDLHLPASAPDATR